MYHSLSAEFNFLFYFSFAWSIQGNLELELFRNVGSVETSMIFRDGLNAFCIMGMNLIRDRVQWYDLDLKGP